MKTLFKIGLLTTCLATLWSCGNKECEVKPSHEDLVFNELATTWDEGMPLGNAVVGSLVWQKDSSLRMSLDHTDLWDLRPADSICGENYRFSWVREHIRNGNYRPVQIKFDDSYGLPAPSKIPGAALEFPINQLGKTKEVHLYLNNALCEVEWENGAKMQTFVHATRPVGWFTFKGLNTKIVPTICTPTYARKNTVDNSNSHAGQGLQSLGYKQGDVVREGNTITYHQKGYGDFYYDVVVTWKYAGNDIYGTWSISTSLTPEQQALTEANDALQRGMAKDYTEHMNFWNQYWAASSITVPDSVIQKQYQNEMYKYGSATREYSAPISLQAVWTADNGSLPPWKGDYHHDLNTQLSYWPTYIGNHLTEGLGYLNTLWNQRDTYKRYTKQYFETDGMNIPGVASRLGEPMGGWIQYAMSQTISAWLSQHFYLHWKYSADEEFLKEKGYPFLKDAAIYMEQQSMINDKGERVLEYSSSPEIGDNSLRAWFKDMTNYDLALMHFLFKATAEMADALNLPEEAAHWQSLKDHLPDFDTDEEGALTFAKGHPYASSHRHFSHAMAFHPLGLIDWSDGPEAQRIIKATVAKLEKYGPGWWCGYSYSWIANMYARMFDGEKASQALRTFADCFCLKNTFHANGDQTRTGKSYFTYRPFTLEGNFAFASGLQEMMLQSHTGVIRVFPAIPASWKDVSFDKLRAMGAFLVSAKMEGGKVTHLSIYSEKGGEATILSPVNGELIKLSMKAGETKRII